MYIYILYIYIYIHIEIYTYWRQCLSTRRCTTRVGTTTSRKPTYTKLYIYIFEIA